MSRCCRRDVSDDETVFVAVEDFAGDFAVANLAKQAVLGHISNLSANYSDRFDFDKISWTDQAAYENSAAGRTGSIEGFRASSGVGWIILAVNQKRRNFGDVRHDRACCD